jgi:hypothetical protein
MRRLVFTLLCGLIVVPTALAASRATGDGVLELKAVSGFVQIGTVTQPAKGALWGQMDRGMLKVVDPVAGDGQIYVSGWETRKPMSDDPKTVVYTGRDLHFRVTAGKYKLVFNGSGIDLTAVGIGVAQLAGDSTALDAGSYALDSGKWTPVPVFPIPTQRAYVPFGDDSQTP